MLRNELTQIVIMFPKCNENESNSRQRIVRNCLIVDINVHQMQRRQVSLLYLCIYVAYLTEL